MAVMIEETFMQAASIVIEDCHRHKTCTVEFRYLEQAFFFKIVIITKLVQSNLGISNSDISNSAKFEASI